MPSVDCSEISNFKWNTQSTQPHKQARKPQLPREVTEVTEALCHLDLYQDPVLEAKLASSWKSNCKAGAVRARFNISNRFLIDVSELRTICNALSHKRDAHRGGYRRDQCAKSSRQRKRKEMMSTLGADRYPCSWHQRSVSTRFVERAWLAWQLSVVESNYSGGQRFGWVALGANFEAIKKIEESELLEQPIRLHTKEWY